MVRTKPVVTGDIDMLRLNQLDSQIHHLSSSRMIPKMSIFAQVLIFLIRNFYTRRTKASLILSESDNIFREKREKSDKMKKMLRNSG